MELLCLQSGRGFNTTIGDVIASRLGVDPKNDRLISAPYR
jgi:hypothetical protein